VLGGVSPSALRMCPLPKKMFELFNLEIALFGVFKVYIPIFSCHFCARKGELVWLEDDLGAQMKFMLVHGLDRMAKSTLGYISS